MFALGKQTSIITQRQHNFSPRMLSAYNLLVPLQDKDLSTIYPYS